MKIKIVGLLLFTAWFSFESLLSAQSQVIIEEGIPKAEIVTANQPSAPVLIAARELQKYLQEISGGLCPMVEESKVTPGKFKIYIGDGEFVRSKGIKTGAMRSDECRLLSGEGWLVIAGKDYLGEPMTGYTNPWRYHESYNEKVQVSAFGDRGTLFGVYHLLQQYFGVRWYMPSDLGTVIQKSRTLKIGKLDVSRVPAFEHRHVYYGFTSTSDDDALWYRRAGFGTPAPVTISHSFGFYFLKYAQTNPEFFAMIDGQRDYSNLSTIMGPGNLDLSNQKLIEKAAEDIIQYFDEDPRRKVFPLCPNDGMKRISDNPESQSQIDPDRGELGKFSNYVWKFVNEVAIRVAKKHPDKLVGCIAYEAYTMPPTRIQKLSPNVAVMICKSRRDFTDPEYHDKIKKSIAEWSKKAATVYSWEYYCDILFNPSWRGFPTFFPHIVQDDLKGLKGVIRGEIVEAESWTTEEYAETGKTKINCPGLQHPLLYVTGQLYWDPSLNLDAMLDEYYRLFYGPAEVPMKKFWQTTEKAWLTRGKLDAPFQVYTREKLEEMVQALNEGVRLTAADSVYRKRIELIKNEFSPVVERASLLSNLKKSEIHLGTIPVAEAEKKEIASSFWKSIDPAPFYSRDYQKATPATHLRAAKDQNNLYLNVICFEPEMKKLKSLATKPDQGFEPAIWNDDSIEVFIVPVPENPNNCYHLIWNAQGALYDEVIHGDGNRGDRTWSSMAKVTVQKEGKNWTSTIAIPWQSLGVKSLLEGQKMTANVYRNRQAGGSYQPSFWTPVSGSANFSPAEFGEILAAPDSP